MVRTMLDSFYLAWHYLLHYRLRTTILVCCIIVISFLPLTLQVLLDESEQQLAARANNTPLLLGAKGSALDLVMNSLYFSDEIPEPITMQAVDQVMDSELAAPIPLYIRFQARGYPVVGTTLDYFDLRSLHFDAGEMFTTLGQCVLGAKVSHDLGLKPGDSITTSPETLFDLGGVYPLKLKITGVLQPTNNSDDLAVFVDINTAWVIQGLGHGHQNLAKSGDASVILKQEAGNITANAKLMQYTEITPDNIDSFHLHGDPLSFPLTAVIAFPNDEKSGTILQGRYLRKDTPYQIVRPNEVIDSLMANIIKIKKVIHAVIVVVSSATLLAIVLVFSLSLRLREQELKTIFKLGCSRATIFRLLAAEITIILLISSLVCSGLLIILSGTAPTLVRTLFI